MTLLARSLCCHPRGLWKTNSQAKVLCSVFVWVYVCVHAHTCVCMRKRETEERGRQSGRQKQTEEREIETESALYTRHDTGGLEKQAPSAPLPHESYSL